MMNFNARFTDHAMNDHASEIDYAVSMMFSASHLPSGTPATAATYAVPQLKNSLALSQREMPRQALSLWRN
ncbi:MAG: hypothetical protein R3A44_33535 [Caldilineaceae bacterium]